MVAKTTSFSLANVGWKKEVTIRVARGPSLQGLFCGFNPMLVVNETLTLPERELSYSTSRSSGPGGQNVNKVESRVTLLFDVTGSATLTEEQKRRILGRLPTRINREGVLRVVSQKHRTQAANRKEARQRLANLLAVALRTRRPRKPTRPSAEAKRRRLEEKRRRAELKRLRGGAED